MHCLLAAGGPKEGHERTSTADVREDKVWLVTEQKDDWVVMAGQEEQIECK